MISLTGAIILTCLFKAIRHCISDEPSAAKFDKLGQYTKAFLEADPAGYAKYLETTQPGRRFSVK